MKMLIKSCIFKLIVVQQEDTALLDEQWFMDMIKYATILTENKLTKQIIYSDYTCYS